MGGIDLNDSFERIANVGKYAKFADNAGMIKNADAIYSSAKAGNWENANLELNKNDSINPFFANAYQDKKRQGWSEEAATNAGKATTANTTIGVIATILSAGSAAGAGGSAGSGAAASSGAGSSLLGGTSGSLLGESAVGSGSLLGTSAGGSTALSGGTAGVAAGGYSAGSGLFNLDTMGSKLVKQGIKSIGNKGSSGGGSSYSKGGINMGGSNTGGAPDVSADTGNLRAELASLRDPNSPEALRIKSMIEGNLDPESANAYAMQQKSIGVGADAARQLAGQGVRENAASRGLFSSDVALGAEASALGNIEQTLAGQRSGLYGEQAGTIRAGILNGLQASQSRSALRTSLAEAIGNQELGQSTSQAGLMGGWQNSQNQMGVANAGNAGNFIASLASTFFS